MDLRRLGIDGLDCVQDFDKIYDAIIFDEHKRDTLKNLIRHSWDTDAAYERYLASTRLADNELNKLNYKLYLFSIHDDCDLFELGSKEFIERMQDIKDLN